MTARVYEIHIRGPLPAEVLEELVGLEVRTEEPRTVLHGPVRDQAALLGVLLRLQGVGIEVVDVQQFPAQTAVEGT